MDVHGHAGSGFYEGHYHITEFIKRNRSFIDDLNRYIAEHPELDDDGA